MYGIDVIYLPRTTVSRDEIFGEDIETKFSDNFLIEMYLQTVDGFEGEGDLLAKFGLQIKQSADFVVSKRRFEEVLTHKERPAEGDLLYFPLSHSIFEVNYVDLENPFYQLGKLHTYKLSCSLFTFSHEEFDTGIEDIDLTSDDHNKAHKLVDSADNDDIEVEAEQVLDYEEKNPFGDW